MKRRVCLACLIALLLCSLSLAISAGQEETVIYRNDFSAADSLVDFKVQGNWRVRNGTLETQGTGGSAFLIYTLPTAYAGMDFRVDVDFLGHTSTGGILIGGDGEGLSAAPSSFFGYDCFIGTNGQKGALGCYTASGAWSGNIHVGKDTITARDLHLSVTVSGNELTYLVTSLDGATCFYGVTYTIGTSARDVYSMFGGQVGLRKFYADKGRFDNFSITLLHEPSLPTFKQTLPADFSLSCTVSTASVSRLYFGMNGASGYMVRIDRTAQSVSLWRIADGAYTRLCERSCAVGGNAESVRVRVADRVAAVYYGDDAADTAPFPEFELLFSDYTAGQFGIFADGGTVGVLAIDVPESYTSETYTNPVTPGADPDILYYDGTYYLYNRINAGNAVFRVSTSPDLVHWTARKTVFWHTDGAKTHGYMSPNVFYHDGVFYLFYAALNEKGENRVWYATATSPYGPFLPPENQKPLHDTAEIGGHPYRDDDGRLYMSFVRFGGGNFVWLEEVRMQNGTVTPVAGTATCVISPAEAYENDGYGSIAEGGVLYKHKGLYYMIYASGHYKGHYGESYAVAENILGPYTKYAYNEILTRNAAADGVGDGIFVPSPDGTELFMVYHSHAEPGKIEPRQTCIDRMKFVSAADGGPDILTVYGPTTTAQPLPSDTLRGDMNGDGEVTVRDALLLCRKLVDGAPYSGRGDMDRNGTNDAEDIAALLAAISE